MYTKADGYKDFIENIVYESKILYKVIKKSEN